MGSISVSLTGFEFVGGRLIIEPPAGEHCVGLG